MERKGRKTGNILTLLTVLSISACSDPEHIVTGDDEKSVSVRIVLEGDRYTTKALMPEEDIIRDLNITVFEEGRPEENIWVGRIGNDDSLEFEVRLVKGKRYTVAAAANFGHRLETEGYEQWKDIVYGPQTSEGYPGGIPMSAAAEDILVGDGTSVRLELVRLAAKISVRIDRSRLSEDVEMRVLSARIGNCPRFAETAGPSRAASRLDVFEAGFELTEEQCLPLNETGLGGLSDEVAAYMLENMQGDSLDADTASYMEILIDYRSAGLISYDSPLIYRFYLGERPGNYDIERNCHYHFTIIPEDDGLSGNGWRVDKSGIGPSTPLFRMHPGDYVEGHVGDSVRIWCECYPRTSPFDPGVEELDYDRNRGIYDYRIDDDRHGVTLYLKKPGTGIVYMSAGEPIDRSGMVIVSVKP